MINNIELKNIEIENLNEKDFVNSVSNKVEDNYEELENTERETIVKTRIGQSLFKNKLLKQSCECKICGLDEEALLIASHIKPWRVSNNNERLDKNNGFIFSPTIDKLFDIGLITFENNKSLLVSKSLDKSNIISIGIEPKKVYEKLPLENRMQYLEYHRNFIFLD